MTDHFKLLLLAADQSSSSSSSSSLLMNYCPAAAAAPASRFIDVTPLPHVSRRLCRQSLTI